MDFHCFKFVNVTESLLIVLPHLGETNIFSGQGDMHGQHKSDAEHKVFAVIAQIEKIFSRVKTDDGQQ